LKHFINSIELDEQDSPNEAVEVALHQAKELIVQDEEEFGYSLLKQVIIIGDAPAHTEDQIKDRQFEKTPFYWSEQMPDIAEYGILISKFFAN